MLDQQLRTVPDTTHVKQRPQKLTPIQTITNQIKQVYRRIKVLNAVERVMASTDRL